MAHAATSGQLETFPQLLARNAAQFGDKPAYREKEFGIWQSWTWVEARDEIEALAYGLLEMGLAEGDHVALLGPNRPHLYWTMVAVQMCGAVPVPIYHDSVGEEIAYVLDHCGARYVVAQDQEQVDKVIEVKDRLPTLEDVIYLDPRGMRKYDHTHLRLFADVQTMGRGAHDALEKEMSARLAKQTGATTCVMLYTSGTTGRPKGVVLSNDNIILTSKNSGEFDHLRQDDDILAYLPLAWVGDFIFSVG